jgi:hypothetical protein
MTPSRICKTRDMQHQRGGSRAAKEQGVQRCAQPVAQLLRRLPGAPCPGAFLCLGLEATGLEESWPAAVLTGLGAAEVGSKQGRERSGPELRLAPIRTDVDPYRRIWAGAPPRAARSPGSCRSWSRTGELLRVGEVLVRGRRARTGASRGARLVLPPVVELAWRRGPRGRRHVQPGLRSPHAPWLGAARRRRRR